MKYPDGLGVDVAVHVEAAVPRVWELVTDIRLPARFSPELRSVAWLDGADGPVVGARFEGVNHHPMLGEWRTVSQVIEADEHRAFAWAVLDADGRYGEATLDPEHCMSSWHYEIEAEDTGTRLRQTVRLGPGRSGLATIIERQPDQAEEIVASRLKEVRAGMETTLHGIKAFAEEDGRSG
ncbi:SRPBCC family protein [Streptomyces sp. NPDC052042]|uniref:SRPBCC family protein n=1 Tax=Streptomyces sp. NPDC052042 TaxID=3365683 RepID=UPI0037D12BBF